MIPADLNPDPFLEDVETGAGFNSCTDGTCDGVELTSTGTCSITAAKPDGAFSGPKDPVNEPFSQRQKEPELLAILITSLADGENCVITLHLVTDGNPGHVATAGGGDPEAEDCLDLTDGDGSTNDCFLGADQLLLHTQYEPGNCELIADTPPPFPVYNTVSLNDGVKIFSQDEASDDDFDDGFREIGPTGSLQLTANGADVVGTLTDPNIGEEFCVVAP